MAEYCKNCNNLADRIDEWENKCLQSHLQLLRGRGEAHHQHYSLRQERASEC